MKKIVCFVIAVLMCLSLIVPAFAAEADFVPSITYKPDPGLVQVQDENGQYHAGLLRGPDGSVVGYIDTDCLMMTPVAKILDGAAAVAENVSQLLKSAYDRLSQGKPDIPYPDNAVGMIIRDLFDISWGCEDHCDMLDEEGVTLELTFDLGIGADVPVYVHTLQEALGEWTPIVSVTNNGDGTITCVFEHLCVVAVSVAMDPEQTPVVEPETPDIWMWVGVLTAAVAGLLAILFFRVNAAKAAAAKNRRNRRGNR